MSVLEAMKSAQLIVGPEGKPTGVVLDMQAWESLLTMLEDVEDLATR
jgi:hypothetical protein